MAPLFSPSLMTMWVFIANDYVSFHRPIVTVFRPFDKNPRNLWISTCVHILALPTTVLWGPKPSPWLWNMAIIWQSADNALWALVSVFPQIPVNIEKFSETTYRISVSVLFLLPFAYVAMNTDLADKVQETGDCNNRKCQMNLMCPLNLGF